MPALHTATRCLLGLLLALLAASAARAADSAAADSPGWYRTQIGRLTVTALWDGTLDMPANQVFARPSPARLKALLAHADQTLSVPLSVNAFVIDTGQRTVMIDTGTGASRMFGDALGKVQSNLRAAGYMPEQIAEIYISHMHTDHVGGLTVDGTAVYPKAVVRAEQREAGHYLSREKMAAAGDEKEDFESAMAMLAPYVQSGRFQPFDGKTELAPGVHALPAWGHTPGHTVYLVESEGQKLVLWGDLMHVAAVQLPLPAATLSFEASQRQAAASRAAIFRQAAREGWWIAAAHMGFPGIGKLKSNGRGGYDWVPIAMVRGR